MKKENAGLGYEDQWSGYVHYSHTMIDKGDRDELGAKTEWNNFRDASMFIRVNNNKGWAHVNDRLSKWQRTTITEQNAQPSIQIIKSDEAGGGSGDIAVWVEMDPESRKYWLKMDGPSYPVHKVDSMIQTFAGTTIVNSGSVSSTEKDGFPVDAPDQAIGKNTNEVKGRYVIMHSYTHYVVVSWHLKKTGKSQTLGNPKTNNTNPKPNANPNSNPGSNSGSNSNTNSNPSQAQQNNFDFVELIVTPENYNDWMPSSDGNKLKVFLEVRGRNGTQPPLRAVSFELGLFSTSSGGATSNSGSGSFDIRLLPQTNAEISNKDQFMTMPCTNGRTGEFAIGTYHQSASTTLVTIAILEDGRKIKGNLLKSGGVTEIPIPKTNTP